MIIINNNIFKVDVNNNNSSNDNEETSRNGYNHQSYQSMLNIPGANELILKQIKEYINEKYPNIQNRMEMIKEKLEEFRKKFFRKSKNKYGNYQ
jgi:hypothetical protein